MLEILTETILVTGTQTLFNYKQKQILKNEKYWAKLFLPILLMTFCIMW